MKSQSLTIDLHLRLDKLCDEFESAWESGIIPSIVDFATLATSVQPPLDARQVAIELAMIDMECRWNARQNPKSSLVERSSTPELLSAEDYIQIMPILGPLESVPVELIEREIQCRLKSGLATTQVLSKFDGHNEFSHIAEYCARQHSSFPNAANLSVRCPHCRETTQVLADQALDSIVCAKCNSAFSFANDTLIPLNEIHHFQVLERLGVGGFGTVWKATDTKLGRTVAIKIPRKGALNAKELEMFVGEARAAAQLNHPNIVSVHEVGKDGNRPYIVSDFVDGVPLSDWLTENQISFRRTAKFIQDVAEALEYAHAHGVVHRDLKPANIMLSGNTLTPHITDFGLAKADANEVTVTADGMIIGTAAYMSPEQARGNAHEADRRSDIYSLGVILYEMLTGELPFRGSFSMMINQVLFEDPKPLRKLNNKIPRDLETICLKCLEKRPENRFASAKDLVDELRRFQEGVPIQSRPLGPVTTTLRWARRKPFVAATAILLLVISIASPLVAIRIKRALNDSIINEAHATVSARKEGYREIVFDRLATVIEDDRRFGDSQRLRNIAMNCLGDFIGIPGKEIGPFEDWLSCLAISQNGDMIAAGFNTGFVRLFDTNTSQEIASVQAYRESMPKAILFKSTDDSSISIEVVGKNGIVLVFNHKDRKWSKRRIGPRLIEVDKDSPEGTIWSAYSTANQRYLAIHDTTFAIVWDTESEPWTQVSKMTAPPDLHGCLTSVAVNFDGTFLTAGFLNSEGSGFLLQNLNDESVTRIGPFGGTHYPEGIDFGRETNSLVFGCEASLRYRFAKELVLVNAPIIGNLAAARFFGPDDRYLATLYRSGDLVIDNIASSERMASLAAGPGKERQMMAVSLDESQIATCDGHGIRTWNLTVPERLVLHAHESAVTELVFHPFDDTMVSTGKDGSVHVWNTNTGKKEHSVDCGHPAFCAAFSPDGRFLAVGLLDKRTNLIILDAQTWKQVEIDLPNKLEEVLDIAFFHDASNRLTLVAGGLQGIHGWRIVKDEMIPTGISDLRIYDGWVQDLNVSKSSKTLAWVEKKGVEDAIVRAWDLMTNQEINRASAIKIYNPSKGWNTISLLNDDLVYLSRNGHFEQFDLRSNKKPILLFGKEEHFEQFSCVSPLGGFQAVLINPRTVEIRRLSGGKRTRFRSEESVVNTITWSPRENKLAIGLTNGDISIWDLEEVEKILNDGLFDR